MVTIVKGATAVIQSNIYLDVEQLQPASLVGATALALFKKSTFDLDADAILTKGIGTGITVTDAANGILQTVLGTSDTLSLSFTTLYFEIAVKLASGTIIRSGIEELKISPNLIKNAL